MQGEPTEGTAKGAQILKDPKEQVRLGVRSAAVTDVGQCREHNEDNALTLDEARLYVVADGMGGHEHGEVASQIAVATMEEFFGSSYDDEETWPLKLPGELAPEARRLAAGVALANQKIHDASQGAADSERMGTTIVAMHIGQGLVTIAHVGDSRAYKMRGAELAQLTEDHSLWNEYKDLPLDDGLREYIKQFSNVITRALGVQERVDIDLNSDSDVEVGDRYMLCSDGLYEMVPEQQILEIMLSNEDDAACCEALVHAANTAGGVDNITALVVRVEAGA
ncbi:MAG: protein phosphatase 2C domain-containing protein [Myxococcota bacterium]